MGEDAHAGALMAGGNKSDMVLGARHLFGIFVLLVVLFGIVFTLGYMLGRSQYDPRLSASASTLPFHSSGRSADAPANPASSPNTSSNARASEPPPADWDLYHPAESAKAAPKLPVKAAAVKPPPKPAVKPAAKPAPKAPVEAHANPPANQGASDPPQPKSVSVPVGPASPAASGAAMKVPSTSNSGVPSKASKSVAAPSTQFIPRGATVLQVAALARQADALALASALQKKKFNAFVLNPSTDRYYRVQVGPYSDTTSANAARHQLLAQGFQSIIKR